MTIMPGIVYTAKEYGFYKCSSNSIVSVNY